jgi:glucose/arabinose dehydrogenase
MNGELGPNRRQEIVEAAAHGSRGLRRASRAARTLALAGMLAFAAASCVGGAEEDEEPSGAPSASPTAAAPTPEETPDDPSPTRSGGPATGFDPGRVALELRVVAQGLASPLLATPAGDGSGRLFIVEKEGRIRILEDGAPRSTPFLDISDRLTAASNEQGLLGLAFHPEYLSNGRFFVNYTDLSGDTVVSEFRVSGSDPDLAVPSTERILLRIDQPFANHNGGNLVFGPDGYLYVGTGDGGSAADPMHNGQNLETLLGKLLRIDVDAVGEGAPYGIPPDNPFVDRDGARPEIWAYGLRNPWRFNFDRETGDLWIGDVGQGSLEEVDRVGGDVAGLNYGWNVMEGTACFEPASGCDEGGLTLPVAEYRHDEGCSITGGFVYRGSMWPALGGAYLFADYCSGTIWGLDAADPAAEPPAVLLETGGAISSFGQDEDGELYVTDLASGTVARILAPSP